jgi:hypothetical protein
MQLVPDIEFRMARKGQQQQQTTTMEFNNQQYKKIIYLFKLIFLLFNRENVDENIHKNEISENNENLIDSFQRVNIDDGELSTICVKNFPQQVDFLFSLLNKKKQLIFSGYSYINSSIGSINLHISLGYIIGLRCSFIRTMCTCMSRFLYMCT